MQATTVSTTLRFPIVTAPGQPACVPGALPPGVLGYVNRLAEACLLTPSDHAASVEAASRQRSTVRGRPGCAPSSSGN